ncbi:MAG: rRNA maturation RNase YbeY [Patescibacteria group bacterium]|nr:rRNA maturation RNase YbeY [Patescibacteria group bacterium]
MISIDFNQTLALSGAQLTEKLIANIEDEINQEVGSNFDGQISALLVSDHEIKKLNRIYRHKDEITDVLSFSYLEEKRREENIGDIVISYDQALRQAQNNDIELELTDLLVHGVLHVLGYDHELPEDAKIMFSVQDRIVANAL